jgi:hypothetical protein
MERDMSGLEFDVREWLGDAQAEDATERTLASIGITVNGVVATNVEDTIARTVRDHIRVPAVSLAEWLVANWWRLRCEPFDDARSASWRRAHSLASLGGGYAWPPLEIWSDGESISLRQKHEEHADTSVVRYLSDVVATVPTRVFEQAVDRFVQSVSARLEETQRDQTFSELVRWLNDERGDIEASRERRLEALAGFDADQASDGWFEAINRLQATSGARAIEEALVVDRDASSLEETIASLQVSRACADLQAVVQQAKLVEPMAMGTRPWKRGEHDAKKMRALLAIPSGPVEKATLESLFNVGLPLPCHRRMLAGGWSEDGLVTVKLVAASQREDNQRFFLARMLANVTMRWSDALVPVTNRATAMQKYQRAFAREFLCPWTEIEALVHEADQRRESRESTVTTIAERYGVSEGVVFNMLRDRSPFWRDDSVLQWERGHGDSWIQH